MKRAVITILVIILLAATVFAADLSDFPDSYIDNEGFEKNTAIIVGKAAQAEDVVGSIDIAMTLTSKTGGKTLDLAKLDTEIKDITAYKSIVVGGPCVNSAAAKLLNYPENCMDGFEFGKARIQIFNFDNNNFAILVAGATAQDTRRATYVLANYNDFELEGTIKEISGMAESQIILKQE